jgi:C4-dicarboxylate-specific signal transduction histidine kinase
LNVFRTQSIRRQVALTIGLLLLPFVLGAAWSSRRTRDESAAAVRQEAASVAATSAAYLDQYLRGLDSMASALVLNPSVIAMQRAECDRLLASVLHDQPLLLNVVLHAPDGTIKGSGIQTTEQRPLVPLPHVRQVITTGRPVVSDLTVGPLTQRPTILLGYPVPRPSGGGAMVAVLSLGLNLMALETTFKAIPLLDGSIVTLTSRAGLVLARSRDADRYIGTTVEVPDPTERGAEPHASVKTDVDGVERVVASAVVRRGPWTISVGIPSRVIADRLWPLWWRTFMVAAVAILTSLLAWIWVGRHLSRQLDDLRAAAQRIADGDLSPMKPSRSLNKEMTELQVAFGTMADKLRQARQALDQQVEQEKGTREALERLQRQAVRQERLAAVGLLVSGLAHELNNPLQAILGAGELLERRPELPEDALKEIALVKTQGHRASEIIRNLSRFGTQNTTSPEVIDLRDVVSEVVQIRRADLESAKISCQIDTASTGTVHADFTEIEQVVLNLVINAQQAIQASGTSNGRVVIRSSDAGSCVRLEVVDNGPGVASGDEAKLFQPFFTTKPVGKGTGLGLAVSYGIIDSYGGTIGYQSNDLGGATFFFELPRV